MLSDMQIREVFHFYFLDRLLKLSDPGLYILKGGVNLRFFFMSPRYSEDMDIDVLDLAILIRGGHSPPAPWSKLLDNKDYAQALDCLLSLGWDDYAGQVVEFLNDDSREEFGDRSAWERLHSQVLNALKANA